MSAGQPSGTLYLVDAHGLIFQVFYAIRGMTSPSGLPTNALFGFLRDILFLRSLRPDYLVVAFDRPEPTFRSDIYAEYKANREAMPDDLQLQIPLIHQGLEAMNVPVVSAPRFEADDVMATLAVAGAARGLQVYLCSSDKDCRQLINDKVRMYSLRKHEEFGPAELLEDWGVTPEQVIDLQALVGDSVDNVPGVPGIGVKTAARLLQEFGTLDNLLANVDKVTGKKQEALKASGEKVALSRKLVRLVTDVPLVYDWDAWKLKTPDVERMMTLCREWGFQSLATQIRAQAGPAVSVPKQAELFSAAEELFPFGANETPAESDAPQPAPEQKKWQATYHLVNADSAFEQLVRQLRQQKRFAIDLETTGLDPLQSRIVGVALCWEAGVAHYLALRGPEGEATLSPEGVLKKLKPILEDPGVAKVNQNIKYDLLVLRGHGIHVRGIAGDSMVADYLLHAGQRSHGLDELARRYLDHQVIPITDLIGKGTKKTPQLRMDQVPTAKVAEYAGEDADVAWRLVGLLEPRLSQAAEGGRSLRDLYDDLEVPLIEVLAELEFNGIRLDGPFLKKLSGEMSGQLATIEEEIHTLAGRPFNIGSLPQLRAILFDELKLPVQGRTGVTGAPSTDQESLEKLAALKHPGAALPRKVIEYRQISKLLGTYVDVLPQMVNPDTGRIHASFNQTVASSGRLSSSDPNLQNIPIRREMGEQIRQAFVPNDGWKLICADYSQIELRLLAHFCQDEQMLDAFARDRDIHAAVASQIFHVAEEAVTSDQRRMAKMVNFGVIYGISAAGLGQRLGMSKDEATKFIKAYFGRYPRVEQYHTNLLKECKRRGYTSTILGRRRQFDQTAIRENSSYQQRNTAEREAINMEVQGSAADLIKLAMLNIHRRLKKESWRSRMLLQIHDELVFESPPEEQLSLVAMIRKEMTEPVAAALKLRVNLRVDVSSGPNWLDVANVE